MMNSEEIDSLKARAGKLKNEKQVFDALLLRFQLERHYRRAGAALDEHCFNLNWIAYLGLRTLCLYEAERAARQCLYSYRVSGKSRESLATYLSMLASVLAECRRFDEAVEYGEEALTIFVENHGENAPFVYGRRLILERMRRHDTDTYVVER